jgi:hypothetical protein
MREYIFGTGVLAVVVVALCLGWPVYNSVAQIDDAADNNTLTVEQCIDATDDSADPIEEVMIEKDMIDEGLLQTKVTNSMCEAMLEPVTDSSLVRRLLAAQNYMQEIKLIKGAMHEAAGKAAARRPDRYSSSDESLIQFRDIAQTSEEVPAQAQYEWVGGVAPITQQAAGAAGAGEDADAPIAKRLRQKENSLLIGGALAREAEAGGLCGLQIESGDEKWAKATGLFTIEPSMPPKMLHGETEQAGLRVSPLTKEKLKEITQQYSRVAEISESEVGCVKLTDSIEAVLMAIDPKNLAIDGRQNDIRELSSGQSTKWGWKITARKTGEQSLLLNLGYDISGGDSGGDPEFRQLKTPRKYAIKVTPLQKPPWWQRIFERISEIFGA